jgi:hypothetical protein
MEQPEQVKCRLLERTTKLQKEEKNHEVESQDNLQQAVSNTAGSECVHAQDPGPAKQEGTCLLSRDSTKV